MVTVPRKRPYLYQSIATILLSSCDDATQAVSNRTVCTPLSSALPSLHLHVLYTHPEPHPEFEALAAADIPHLTMIGPKFVGQGQVNGSWWQAESADYITALRWCHNEYEARTEQADAGRRHLTLILEDDIVTSRRAIDRLLAGVQPLLDRDDWLLVRLYRTGFYDGWEKEDIAIVVAWSVFGGAVEAVVAVVVDALLCGRRRKVSVSRTGATSRQGSTETLLKSRQKSGVLFQRCLQCFVVIFTTAIAGLITAGLLVLLDKQNLPFFRSPVGFGLHSEEGSAGTQAMVFSSAHITRLIEFLCSPNLTVGIPIDMALNQLTEGHPDMKQFHLVPDLFDHRGIFSSLGFRGKGDYRKHHVSSSFIDEVKLRYSE